MSAFSFTDDTTTDNSESFSFGASEETKHATKPLSAKKSGSRVISAGKKGKKEPKKDLKKPASKFAKAPVAEKAKPSFSSPVSETSAFDFGSSPTTQEESTSAFDFGSSTSIPDEPSSAFDFGSQIEEPTSEFSFGAQTIDTDSQNINTGSENIESKFEFGSEKIEWGNESSIEKIEGENDGSLDSFYESLSNIRQNAFQTLDSISKTRELIKEKEEELDRQLKIESFTAAEKLNTEIKKLKEILNGKKSDFYDLLMKSMELTNEVPQFLNEKKAENDFKIPTLREELELFESNLINYSQIQNEDKQKVEIERKSIASKVEELKSGLQEEEKILFNDKEALLDEIAESRKPTEMEVLGLQLDRKHHEDAISELLKQIEDHKSEIQKIDDEVALKYRTIDQIERSFTEKKEKVANQEIEYNHNSEKVDQEIQKLELPFKSLIDEVNEREGQISSTAALIEDTKLQLNQLVQESDATEQAESKLTGLCESFVTFYEKRSNLNDKLELVTSQINSEISQNYMIEILEITGKKERAEESQREDRVKLPALEAAKKAAVMSKNFRGAQKASDQIKETVENIEKNDKIIQECSEKLEKLETLADNSRKLINSYNFEKSSILNEILNVDYEIFVMTFKKLKELFEISSFCSEILSPFYELIENALENCEKPVIESIEDLTARLSELEAKLQEATEQEDYAAAGNLQDEIDLLNEKIQNQ